MILVPSRELILPKKIRDFIAPRLEGWYKLEAFNPITRKTRMLADWFPNLIVNEGADFLGGFTPGGAAISGWMTFCLVGTGNTPPAGTDTALQSFLASTQSTNFATASAAGSSPYYGARTTQYNFAAGTATGNLSEVGVGVIGTNGELFSHSLILDSLGSPTTITVLSNEALYVTYQLRQYVPLNDVTGSISISGSPYTYTLRAANATSTTSWALGNGAFGTMSSGSFVTNGVLGTITSGPTGTAAAPTSIVTDPYSLGSSQRTATATWGLSDGNLAGGITCFYMSFNGRGDYQMQFGAAIPKDASHVLTLSGGHSWVLNSP